MSINENKLNDFALKLQKDSYSLSRRQLFDLTYDYGIHENHTIEAMVSLAKYGSYAACGLGVLSILIGFFAIFYGQPYLGFFALICFLDLLVGVFAYFGFEEKQRMMFMAIPLLILLWLYLSLIYITDYAFIKNDDSFDTNIMHHFLFFIYLVISIGLAVVYVIIAIKLINCFEEKISRFERQKI